MKLRGIAFVIAFTAGAMYLPTPYNAILVLLAVSVIVLGVFFTIRAVYRETRDRFWNALERPERERETESEYLPYVTTRHRRLK